MPLDKNHNILFRTKTLCFILFLFLYNHYLLTGQDINLRFQHYTSDNGLSQNTVDCILKDSRGFMWFGTWNGLNRFDGYNFVVYKSENNQYSLSNNFIYSICEDQFSNLWVGTKNGLNKFNYSSNRFARYVNDKNNPHSLYDNNISSLFCDHQGVVWIGTSKGLNFITFNNSNQDSIIINRVKSIKDFKGTEKIFCIFEDKQNYLWIGTDNGVVKIDKERKKAIRITNNPSNPNSLTNNLVNCIYEDHLGYIWIGTQFGLNRMDQRTNTVFRYYNNPDLSTSISHFFVNDIKEDSYGNLFIATLGGLNKYNRKNNDFIKFSVNLNSDYSINNEFINSLFIDKQGNVWIGTDKGGVNKFNIYQKQFGYLFHDPATSNSLSNNTINSIFDEKDILWIGTAGGGLNAYDKLTGKFSCYIRNVHYPAGINNDFITSIHRDKSNNLWIGTWGGGLNKLISSKGKGIFKYYYTTDVPSSISSVYVSSVWEDKRGFLVIGTLGGLDLFFPKKDIFMHIANNASWKNHITEVGCILQDKSGSYWIGTRNGLFYIKHDKFDENIQDADIKKYTNVYGNPKSISGNYVISLCEDKNGNIWVGTYGNGICKVETKAGGEVQFINYTEKDGLSNNVVYAILEDDQHNLWLSTDNGLSRFDTQSHLFKNFFITDGLQSNQFYWSAANKGTDGRFYFGGMKGVNYFYPDSIKDYPFIPKVVITDLKIFNSSVPVGQWNKRRIILNRPISEIAEITLSYRENVFSLEFSALEYYLPEKIEYSYKMEGVDNDWVNVPSSRRFANYTNLAGGEYTFLVKAKNSDGIGNDEPTRLRIIIQPPIWRTAWFRIFGSLFIAVSVVLYFRIRTQKLHERKRILEKMVADRTQQIEEQKGQLELQNKEISDQRDKLIELNKRVQWANQLKLRFFTNISHEFRTPLTLILGPVEKLISGWNGDEVTKQTLQLINRNAQRLLHLINQLMEFRKIETGKQELKVSFGDIISFIDNIFQSFEQLAKQRNITYIFIKETDNLEAWIDRDKLENILFNLISNAFKYTPENGIISLKLSKISNDENKMLRIEISDSGIGIDKEHLNNIFKRFYRINTTENLQIKGSGIGLSLTRELVRAHHGSISVESEVGKGTSFTIQIPYLKESFAEKEIFNLPFETKKTFETQINVLTEEILQANEIKNPGDIKSDKENKPIILIVEDNYDLRTFIALGLQDEYNIFESENGKQGFELAKSVSPDIIISDIMMPEMDGLELCTCLKENIQTSHIPIILLTARSTVESRIEGLEIGADDYISKPFDFNVLKARIFNLIESRRKLRKLFSQKLLIDPSEIVTAQADEDFLKKVISIIEENFINPEFGVQMLIDKMAVSRSLLHRKLTALVDQPAGDFITTIRLNKSAVLLKSKQGNISEIAYKVGFNDPKYFTRLFKRRFGVTPSEFMTE